MLADSVLALAGGRDFARGAAHEILVPALLERLFEAPFSLVEAQGRSVPALVLGGSPEDGRAPGGGSGGFAR
jgi:ABC-type hemin transport system ATPase subunit